MVVLIHTAITIDGNWLQVFLSHVLSQVAVPSFFFFSGYLFFLNINQFNRKTYFSKLKGRTRTLLLPYIVWISLWILFRLLLLLKNHESILDYFQLNGWFEFYRLFWDSSIFMTSQQDWLGFSAYMTAPYLVPLWYLRDLMVVCVLTPIIYLAIKRLRASFIVFLALAYITHIWPIHTGATIIALFWFSFGAFYSIRKIDFVATMNRMGILSYFITALLILLEVYFDGSQTPTGFVIHPFCVISMFVSLISLSSLIVKKWRPNILLSQGSFFVYVSHGVFIPYVVLLVNHIIPFDSYLLSMLRYFLVPTVTICLSLSMYLFIRQYSKPLLKLLCGNR